MTREIGAIGPSSPSAFVRRPQAELVQPAGASEAHDEFPQRLAPRFVLSLLLHDTDTPIAHHATTSQFSALHLATAASADCCRKRSCCTVSGPMGQPTAGFFSNSAQKSFEEAGGTTPRAIREAMRRTRTGHFGLSACEIPPTESSASNVRSRGTRPFHRTLVADQGVRREQIHGHLGGCSDEHSNARHRFETLRWQLRRWTASGCP